jgi:hypothetical protein
VALAVARKQAPESDSKAERDDARGAQGNLHRTRVGFSVPFIQRKPTCACGGGCPRCNEHTGPTELKIGQPGDRYEQEADRMAERVTQVRDPQQLEEPLILQRHAAQHHAEPAMVPPIVHEVLRSPGQLLDPATRAFMEPRFGHDFSHVRVHTDARAAESARAINALAYTVGRDVVFGAGQYTPRTAASKRLLAHELTHVVQQANVPGTAYRGASEAQDSFDRPLDIGRVSEAVGHQASTGIIFRQRAPDITGRGFHTWYVRIGNVDRAFAIQIGRQPGSERVSIRFASLRPGMRNPAEADRTMILAISPGATLAPRITDESETALPDGVSFQKVITIELNEAGAQSQTVTIILHYSSGLQDVPFVPREAGGSAYWRPERVESAWLAASDGYREISVNFPGVYPSESLLAEGSRPFVHPGLGYGYVHPRRGFIPYPAGRPLISAQAGQRFVEELTRTGIHLIPVVGPLVMIGEALVGRSIWGRNLSTTERVILGAGALLAEIGPLIRAGRAAVAASRLSTVAGVSQLQALRMIMASRVLTATERATLERLSAEIRAGRALSEADQVLANRLIGKMSEHLRVAATRAEVEAVTGVARQPGRFTNLGTSISADEARVGQALARDLNADVVRPLESTVPGVKNPDYILDDVVAELYSPRTGNIENLIREAVKKHRQGGVMVVDLTHSPVSPTTVLGSAGRFFGRPEFADVGRLIFVQGDRVIGQALRPATSSLAPTIIRGGASAAAAAGGGRGSEE